MSISMFTGSPGFIEPNPVTEAVCGIMLTPNISSRTSFTVNDTPFTATLPFTAMKRAFTEVRDTGTFTGLTAQECVDARQQIEDLVGLERFYEIEEATVEEKKWGKR